MSSEFGFHTTGEEVINAFSSSIARKTIILTGPTPTSLGAKVVELLCSHPTHKPASIILLGRSLEKTQPLIAKLNALSPNTTTPFISIELSSFASVRSAAASIIALSPKIDVLINNAGVMALHEYSTSPDGVESQFAINYLGPFLLTNLLLSASPSIFNPGARVINVSSDGHAMGPVNVLSSSSPLTKTTVLEAINYGPNGEKYDEWNAYGQSKTAQILSAQTLAKKLAKRDIQAFSLHPGMVFGTAIGDKLVDPDWPVILTRFDKVGRQQPGIKNIEEAMSTMLVAVLDEGLSVHSGEYIVDCKVGQPIDWARDAGNAEKLWEISEVLVGEKFEF